jgi:hypothetical protein
MSSLSFPHRCQTRVRSLRHLIKAFSSYVCMVDRYSMDVIYLKILLKTLDSRSRRIAFRGQAGERAVNAK